MTRSDEAYPTDIGSQQAGESTSNLTDASVGELMTAITADMSSLMRQEVELAKAEIRQEATRAGKGVGMLGGAAYAGYMVLLVGTFAAVFGIASLIGLGWAALTMTGAWAMVAAVLGARGRNEVRAVNPKPERTVQTLKEDAQWARHPTS